MRRLIDLLLIALFLGALAFGAYEIGTRTDNYSNRAAAQDSELTQKPTTTPSTIHKPTQRTVYFVVGGIAIGVGAIVLGSLLSSLAKSRRRQRWHAT
jgi:hypothetical protein